MRRVVLFLSLAALASGAVVGPARAGDDDPWTPLLERIPGGSPYRAFVVLTDLGAAREALDLPDERDDPDDALHDLLTLSTDGGIGALPRLFQRDPEEGLRDELGFGITDVERLADAGVGPTAVTLLEGDFSTDEIESAAETDDAWSDELETKEHAGVDYLSWGDEGVDPSRVSDARPLGQGGRLALDEGFLWWTTATAAIERSLDAAAGNGRSLADVPAFARLADAMARLDAYSVLMTNEPIDADPFERLPDAALPGLEPYRALATGAGRDGDGPLMLVVLVHADEDDAEANAERLRQTVEEGVSAANGQPWRELLEVDEIEVDGTVVSASLRASNPALWYAVVLQRDSLLAAGERS